MTADKLIALAREINERHPGPWSGDRIDGTIKYNLIDAKSEPIVRGDNGNTYYEEGFVYGIQDADEDYFKACSPDRIAALAELWKAVEKQDSVEATLSDEVRNALATLAKLTEEK